MQVVTPSKNLWTTAQSEELALLAKRYIWWNTPKESMQTPHLIIAQVMNLGMWNDVCRLEKCVGARGLREVIRHAEIGMFNDRSWHYWHYRLGLAPIGGAVPPLPKRKLSYD